MNTQAPLFIKNTCQSAKLKCRGIYFAKYYGWGGGMVPGNKNEKLMKKRGIRRKHKMGREMQRYIFCKILWLGGGGMVPGKKMKNEVVIIIYSVCPIFTNPPDWWKALSNGVKTHLFKLKTSKISQGGLHPPLHPPPPPRAASRGSPTGAVLCCGGK